MFIVKKTLSFLLFFYVVTNGPLTHLPFCPLINFISSIKYHPFDKTYYGIIGIFRDG